MGLFKDSLRTWFYGSGAKAIANTSNVCLLDASGNPIGCDTIQRVSAFVFNKDEFVDMGLPSGRLWAKRNLGALKETDYGYYFSWGNLNGHSEGSGYTFSRAKYNTTPAVSIATNLTLAQDAAHSNIGKGFMLSTQAEYGELFNSEYTEFIDANGTVISGTDKRITYNGVNGVRIRSKINGNIIFFPSAGYYSDTTMTHKGDYGHYWTSSYDGETQAKFFGFTPNGIFTTSTANRFLGFTIRPVI